MWFESFASHRVTSHRIACRNSYKPSVNVFPHSRVTQQLISVGATSLIVHASTPPHPSAGVILPRKESAHGSARPHKQRSRFGTERNDINALALNRMQGHEESNRIECPDNPVRSSRDDANWLNRISQPKTCVCFQFLPKSLVLFHPIFCFRRSTSQQK